MKIRSLITALLSGASVLSAAAVAKVNAAPAAPAAVVNAPMTFGGPTTKNILYGGTANLAPTFQDGTGAIDHSVGAVTSGQTYPVSPVSNTTYTLTVTNAAGDSVNATVDVTVTQVSMTPVTPGTKILSVGHTFQFAGGVASGAVDNSVTWSVVTAGGGSITNTGLYTAPANAGTYTIQATSNADASKYQQAVVTVVDLPVITGALTATPAAINYGATSNLTATFTGGTAHLTDGAALNNVVTSPVAYTTPALTGNVTYTLTVTNAAGDSVTSQATVTVTNVSMTALNPGTKTISETKTLQFTGAVVSGAVDTTVTWSVNGIAGGNASVGTIDTSGLYHAPATVPGDTIVTITAKSNANNAVVQNATVTVVKLPTITDFSVN